MNSAVAEETAAATINLKLGKFYFVQHLFAMIRDEKLVLQQNFEHGLIFVIVRVQNICDRPVYRAKSANPYLFNLSSTSPLSSSVTFALSFSDIFPDMSIIDSGFSIVSWMTLFSSLAP